jgi:hypothetical protein
VSDSRIIAGDCLTVMQGMASGTAALTMTSPPYEDCRLYRPLEFKAKGQDWVDWMVPRVLEMCRVTEGLVFVNMAGKVRQFKYSPVVEWLVADLTRNCGIVCGPAPYVFHRIGIPGSGGPHYHRRDWEPVYAFARPECVPPKWSDNTVMGHPPKWGPGGEMSNRQSNGTRRNAWGKSPGQVAKPVGPRQANGERDRRPRKSGGPAERLGTGQNLKGGCGTVPVLANPGNRIEELYTAEQLAEILVAQGDYRACIVGGGVMGDDLCHENEAPFPESLAEFFIRSFAPEGGIVLDPFCGSGTVPKVAERWGRKYIGIDARESQAKLARKRLLERGQPLFGANA